MAKKKTSKQLSPSTVTRMQELGSAWIFKRAIQDSKGWHNWESFTKDPATFNELKKIWMTVGKVEWDDKVDAEWLKSFYKQQKVLLRKIGSATFTLLTRDGGTTWYGWENVNNAGGNELYVWGNGENGYLATNTVNTQYSSPIQISGLWTNFHPGNRHMWGIKAD